MENTGPQPQPGDGLLVKTLISFKIIKDANN